MDAEKILLLKIAKSAFDVIVNGFDGCETCCHRDDNKDYCNSCSGATSYLLPCRNDTRFYSWEYGDKVEELLKKYYNIEILYLWESDILNNLSLCKALIAEYISNNGVLKDYNSFNYQLDTLTNKLVKNKNINPYFI